MLGYHDTHTLAQIYPDSGHYTPASIVFLATRWSYLNTPMTVDGLCVSRTPLSNEYHLNSI
jgi:hypothetical protein